MEISAAALPFLFLAAALLPPTHGYPDDGLQPRGPHRPTDCCPSYTSKNIQCGNMEDYYKTSSGCFRPAVIFETKRGQRVCADPQNEGVQDCMKKLDSA